MTPRTSAPTWMSPTAATVTLTPGPGRAGLVPRVVHGETRPGRAGDLLVERVHHAVGHDEVARLGVEQQAEDPREPWRALSSR